MFSLQTSMEPEPIPNLDFSLGQSTRPIRRINLMNFDENILK